MEMGGKIFKNLQSGIPLLFGAKEQWKMKKLLVHLKHEKS